MALTQEMIDKLRKIAAESTNELARNGAKAKLQAEGVSLTESKPEKVMVAPKLKAERKMREPKAKVVSTNEKRESPDKDKDYKTYCDELISKADERKAKAKAAAAKRANEPKKTDATKNKEAIEKAATRVEKNVEKRVKKGDVSVAEIDKIIAEYETALTKLRALREKATSKMRKGGGVDAEEVEHILMRAQGVKEHHCGCNDSKMATGGNVYSEIAKIKSSLISRAKSKGISENFGQNEVRKLEDKYGYTKEVQAFDDWIMNYDSNSMANGGGIDNEKPMVGTYDGKDAIKGNVSKIGFFTAENGTHIELVSKRNGDSSTGIMFYVAINGRGLYAREYREDAYELYRDEIEKYKVKFSNGGGVGNTAKYYWNSFDKNQKIEFLVGAGYSKSVAQDLSSESWDSLEGSVHKDLSAVLMARGGGVNYKKNWEVVYITLQGKMGKKTITLGRMSDKEDVKQALRRMDLNIREVTSIKEVK